MSAIVAVVEVIRTNGCKVAVGFVANRVAPVVLIEVLVHVLATVQANVIWAENAAPVCALFALKNGSVLHDEVPLRFVAHGPTISV